MLLNTKLRGINGSQDCVYNTKVNESLFSQFFEHEEAMLNSCYQIWGSPVHDNRGDTVLSFINKN